MSLDTEPLREFESQCATVLDVLDRLKALDPPRESDGVAGFVKWAEQFRRAMGTLPKIADPAGLTNFADSVERAMPKEGAGDSPREARSDGTAVTEPPRILKGPAIFWMIAVADWEANGGDPRVSCKFCIDRDGTGPGTAGALVGDAVWVYLPHKTGADPAVAEDDVIPVTRMPDGVLTCVLDTSGSTLPDGSLYQVLTHDGAAWVAGWVKAHA